MIPVSTDDQNTVDKGRQSQFQQKEAPWPTVGIRRLFYVWQIEAGIQQDRIEPFPEPDLKAV